MKHIEIDDLTYTRLVVAARLMSTPVGDVVRRLVDQLADEPASAQESDVASLRASVGSPARSVDAERLATPPAAPPESDLRGWLAVYKTFKGQRVEGLFHPGTHEVRITTVPWAGKVFPSPTAAAIAVVEQYSTGRQTPSTNGRKFWKLVSDGRDLRSIIGER